MIFGYTDRHFYNWTYRWTFFICIGHTDGHFIYVLDIQTDTFSNGHTDGQFIRHIGNSFSLIKKIFYATF